MKKKFKLLLLLFIFCFGVKNVNAVSITAYNKNAYNSFWVQWKLKVGSWSYGYHVYRLVVDGTASPAYCRDAGRYSLSSSSNGYAGPWGTGSWTSGSVSLNGDIVFDPSSSDSTVKKAFGKGITYILGYYGNTLNDSSQVEYVATSIALRVYDMIWGVSWTPGAYYDWTQYKGMVYYYNYAVDNYSSQLSKLKSLVKGAYTINTSWNYNYTDSWNWRRCSGSSYCWSTNEGSDIYYKVMALVKGAINESIDYLSSGAASITWNSTPNTTTGTLLEVNNYGKVYEKIHTYTFDIKKFDSSDSYVNAAFSCSNCANAGAEYKVYANDTLIEDPSKINLLDYTINGTGKVKLKIKFTPNDNYTYDSLNYNIKLSYYDDSIGTIAYSAQEPGNVSRQRYYVLYKDHYEWSKTISNSMVLLDPTCEIAKKLCGEKNLYCDIFKNKYKGTCANCTTYIGNAECSESDSEITITEGYDVDKKNCDNVNDNNLNVLECIIDNGDISGNTYQATTPDVENTKENDYCSVWCKEDYHFTLPGIKDASSGRYFSLKASIKGTKTCYTSKIDENNNFKNNLEEARKSLIDYWNIWSKWNAVYNNGGSSSGYVEYTKFNYNGSSYKSYEYYSGYKKSVWTASINRLNASIKSYAEIVNKYNSCFGKSTYLYNSASDKLSLTQSLGSGWKIDYNFNPDISFWYEESYMSSSATNKLEKTIETTGSVEIDSISEKYYYGDDGKVPNSVGNKTNLKLNNFVCYKVGENDYTCGYKEINYSYASYVSQTITATGNYITPTQFYTIYSTGSIAASLTNIEGDVQNSSQLTNALPVGLGTGKGVYNYVLQVENLGEYYNKSNSLGRIWGSVNSTVEKVLEKAGTNDSCVSDGALKNSISINDVNFDGGVYTCAYRIDCPDCPIDIVIPPDEDCQNCIININYRPITTEDLNPNNRDLGDNWKYDDKIDTALELKAYVTTEEIMEDGETIYDSDNIVAEFTLDSKMITKIRNYNKEHEDDGGYFNNSLLCYDHTNPNDGKVYKNIYCYSTFIDELIYDKNTKKNVTIDKRIIGSDAESSDKLRREKSDTSEYWTVWSNAKWSITTEIGLAYYNQKYEEIGIGPSWK